MSGIRGLNFILHVSDFHLSTDTKELEFARAALKKLADKLNEEGIKISYVIHTGDVIDSSDLYEKIASELHLYKKYGKKEKMEEREEKVKIVFDDVKFANEAPVSLKVKFNEKIKELTGKRFESAENVMKTFISDLNVAFGNVMICCGNHDAMRLFDVSECPVSCKHNEQLDTNDYQCEDDNSAFELFYKFLNNLCVANSEGKGGEEVISHCKPGDLNVVILNTNWRYPPKKKSGYYCVRCEDAQRVLNEKANESNKLNVVIAHKPIYEICETARLSYKRYVDTKFMASLQAFIGSNGIYLCGDKHTRSIVGSNFHDIPHYLSGEPLRLEGDSKVPFEVEYNLIEVKGNSLGVDRKVHLKYEKELGWTCNLRPQDSIPSRLYELSKVSISRNVFEIMASHRTDRTWESFSQQFYRFSRAKEKNPFVCLNALYQPICKLRERGQEDFVWPEGADIFQGILERLKKQIKSNEAQNIMNIRGEYSSGKSTFLGLLYLYMMDQYSLGEIDFIPAYFNLENKKILESIEKHGSYHEASKSIFSTFCEEVQAIAEKEHQAVCYIVDGLDEQDCWSYCSEDSVGRGLLDVLSQYKDSFYIMAFSQHRLPVFKNTMPARKYNDKSDILYFNPIDVQVGEFKSNRFESFVKAFIKLKTFPEGLDYNKKEAEWLNEDTTIHDIIKIIRKFRRLTINPGFMYHNYDFLVASEEKVLRLAHKNAPVEEVYRYYIDRLYEICLDNLGYGFIKYAPAMAFLFSYQGYTYERFQQLQQDCTQRDMHVLKPIWENHGKIYSTFLFIKKQKDAREYLIALHYNRELMYYAEHPNIQIEEKSILNEFITRNVAVLIRKLWTDTNKFVMVCEKLLQRDELGNCTQSMLIYCLAHMKMYKPLQDNLLNKMKRKAEHTLVNQYPGVKTIEKIKWDTSGKDYAERLQKFLNLSLMHTLKIFDRKNRESSIGLIGEITKEREFAAYNLQYQRLYYGDVYIHGEDTLRHLNPSIDKVGKGFDFHNCYNYLCAKLCDSKKYPLREFDMYTLWFLVNSRLSRNYLDNHCEAVDPDNTFFYRPLFKEKSTEVLCRLNSIFQDYLREYREEDLRKQSEIKTIEDASEEISKELAKRQPSN